MTWTYSGDPSASNLDAVRFMTGDTDTTDQLVTDGEINYALTAGGGVTAAAVTICQAIAAKFSRQADKSVGDLRISLSQKAQAYLSMADKLEQKGSRLAIPFACGLSVDEKETSEADTSAVQPLFRRGMMNDGM